MRRLLTATAAIAITLAPVATAQDSTAAAGPTVEAAVGTGVAERALVGAAESFPASTEAVICFTRITDAANSEIEHVWYKGDAEMVRVKLTIGGSPWRTWSRKSLGADSAGDWRCDVVQAGKVLQSVKFRVE